MRVVADLHIHSKYSRATSKELNIDNLEKYARIKGLNLLGTGDFTHPLWLKELKEKLKETDGILKTANGFNFVLQAEISLIYTQDGKGRRIHNVLLAPSFEVVDQINEALLKKGRLDYDGRPIFNFNCVELVEMMRGISEDIEIIPAHCLLPGALIHANPKMKKINKIRKGDSVLTHTGQFRKVTKIFDRDYKGKVYKIVPWYFREGLTTTPEHPFFVIKSKKNCSWTKGTCKPLCSQREFCKRKAYQEYEPTWVQAKILEKGDFLIYPRPTKIVDVHQIRISDFINSTKLDGGFVLPRTSRNKRNKIKNVIKVDKDFCLLAGYYLAEGYTIEDEAVAFSFNAKEKGYIEEVIRLIKKIFGTDNFKIDCRRKNQADIIFYSHILNRFFKGLFYSGSFRAWNKDIPGWMVLLPKKKLAEVLRGWWRGDYGYTVSRGLANQMKLICLKLGIIPSVNIDSSEDFNRRGKHFIEGRKITTQRDTLVFSNLSFFEEDYGMLNEGCFKKFVNKRKTKHGWIDLNYVYLPVRKIRTQDYEGKVYNLEVEKDNSYVAEFATVHNCWTPWFSLFGSMSGFDSVEQAFKEKTKYIHALETGLSSDPEMNWRLSSLDRFSLTSNSDLHSFWPWRIGRECNIFDVDLTYKNLLNALRTKKGFVETIEVDPGYGKYHFDGHRLCNVCMDPKDSLKNKDICPRCGRKITIGVLHRVEELADRPEGFKPEGAVPFRRIIPLSEILAAMLNSGIATKKTWEEYYKLLKLGSEMDVLLDVPLEKLKTVTDEKIAGAIIKNRNGKINIQPGFDGVYGKALVDEKETVSYKLKHKQTGLDEFIKK